MLESDDPQGLLFQRHPKTPLGGRWIIILWFCFSICNGSEEGGVDVEVLLVGLESSASST